MQIDTESLVQILKEAVLARKEAPTASEWDMGAEQSAEQEEGG